MLSCGRRRGATLVARARSVLARLQAQNRRLWVAPAVLLVSAALMGCGDGAVFVIVNTGIVLGSPQCRTGSGQFDLQEQGGVVVLVVIGNDTTIIAANGLAGTCSDIAAQDQVQVRGKRTGSTIAAQTVQIQ